MAPVFFGNKILIREKLLKMPEMEDSSKEGEISKAVIDSSDPLGVNESNLNVDTTKSGPYKLVNLYIQEPMLDEEAKITTIESWENNIYIGTSRGQIIHYYKIDDTQGYIQISKQWIHQSKRNPIRKLLILSEIGKVCVLYGKQLTCLSLPELSPANIGKVKDINDIGFNWSDLILHDNKLDNKFVKKHSFNDEGYCQLIAFTSSSIRILRIFKDSIRLHKDIPFEDGILRGVQNGSFVPIAVKNNQYDLIDIGDSKMIPLFPIFTNDQLAIEPQMAVLNDAEFLLVSGGQHANDQSMGMCINTKGDITRTTLSWDEYPHDLIIDFPYVIAVCGEKRRRVCIHSLHDLKEVAQIDVPFGINISQVFKIFKMKDSSMVEKRTIGPFISQMDNDDIERITVEFDKANRTNLVETSILVYDDFGKDFQLLQPISKIDRWLNTYNRCSVSESQFVFDKLMDELKGSRSEDKFLISLLGLFSLKFGLTNQLFEIWYGNYKFIDPRILIYVMEKGGIDFKSSVWAFNGLFEIIEDLKQNLVITPELIEFYKLYLSSCLGLEFKKDHEDIMRSIEISYLKRNLESFEVLNGFVNVVRYSKHESIEILLLSKRYWILCKLYRKLGYHSQYLYYLRGLISGDLKDDWYNENPLDSLNVLTRYLMDEFLDNFELLWEYIEWVLSEYPEIGLKMAMDSKMAQIGINEIQVLNLVKSDKLQCEYLRYLYETKEETQFLGDLTVSSIKNLMNRIRANPEISEEINSIISRYQRLPVPRVSFEQYWHEFGAQYQNEIFFKYHEMGLKYLNDVNEGTRAIIVEAGNGTCLEVIKKLINGYEGYLPLICVKISTDYKIVEILCEIGDYVSAEKTASGNETLLGIIFERYVSLGRYEMIDRFLLQYRSRSGLDELERMDEFTTTIAMLPDDMGVLALGGFLLEMLVDFHDAGDSSSANVELRRSLFSEWKNWVI